MKLYDFVSKIEVDPAKLTTYALNRNHIKGKHKAIVFEAALGFTADNYQALLRQIIEKALGETAVIQKTDQYGQHLRVDILVQGTAKQEEIIRTGWRIAPRSETAVLSTLYVLGE